MFRLGDYKWPSGIDRSAAMFVTTPEILTARTGLQFESDVDDLDYFRELGLELPSGRHVVLLWYERAPVQGLCLQIDAADDPVSARADLFATLPFSESELIWVPESDPPAGSYEP